MISGLETFRFGAQDMRNLPSWPAGSWVCSLGGWRADMMGVDSMLEDGGKEVGPKKVGSRYFLTSEV
jgi:hypothetical protein